MLAALGGSMERSFIPGNHDPTTEDNYRAR